MVKYYCGLCETSHHALIESFQCEQCARIFCKQSIQEMISTGMSNCPYCDQPITFRVKVENDQSIDDIVNNSIISPTSVIDETFVSHEHRIISQLEMMIGEKIPRRLEIKDWFFGILKHDTNITGLGLWSKGLATIPDDIGHLKELELLDLSDNKLTKIPESIGTLVNLQELYLSGNDLEALPQTIGQLQKLKKLYLDDNNLSFLPESIGSLIHLEELALDHNQLTILPNNIALLSNLHTLFLNNNQLRLLPESMVKLESLQVFDWHDNDLNSSKFSLAMLNWLNLRGNDN